MTGYARPSTALPSTSMGIGQRLTPDAARRRTLRVKATRLAFVAGAVLSALALAGTVGVRLMQPSLALDEAVIQGENMVIDSPRFVGRTKNGDKIIVTAKRATRSLTNETGIVTLDLPVLQTSDGTKAQAKAGTWSQTNQALTLSGDVVLNHHSGDKATAASALYLALPEQLTLKQNVVLTRTSGDVVSGNQAVWSQVPQSLLVEGAVTITRNSGEQARAAMAKWQPAIGALDLSGGVDIALRSGERATAISARLNEVSGDLFLEGQAQVYFNGGQANSARATFFSQTGVLRGEGGVQILTNMGAGSAESYVYETRTKRLNMRGDARVTRN